MELSGSFGQANEWVRNYWSDYRGYDSNGDGVGDFPYRSRRLFELLTDRHPSLKVFWQSPAAQALDFASTAFPIFAPEPKFEDPLPRMKAFIPDIAASEPKISWFWMVASGSLFVFPLAVIVGGISGFRLKESVFRGGEKSLEKPRVSSDMAILVRGLEKRFGRVQVLRGIDYMINKYNGVALREYRQQYLLSAIGIYAQKSIEKLLEPFGA